MIFSKITLNFDTRFIDFLFGYLVKMIKVSLHTFLTVYSLSTNTLSLWTENIISFSC